MQSYRDRARKSPGGETRAFADSSLAKQRLVCLRQRHSYKPTLESLDLALRPPHCLRVRRAGAQIDTALPLALERVAHAYPHAADLLQLDLAKLAILERAEALMVGATGNDVARVQRHDHAGELDQLWHPVLHVVGDVIVIQVAIIPEPHPQLVGVADLVRRSNTRPNGGEGI